MLFLGLSVCSFSSLILSNVSTLLLLDLSLLSVLDLAFSLTPVLRRCLSTCSVLGPGGCSCLELLLDGSNLWDVIQGASERALSDGVPFSAGKFCTLQGCASPFHYIQVQEPHALSARLIKPPRRKGGPHSTLRPCLRI